MSPVNSRAKGARSMTEAEALKRAGLTPAGVFLYRIGAVIVRRKVGSFVVRRWFNPFHPLIWVLVLLGLVVLHLYYGLGQSRQIWKETAYLFRGFGSRNSPEWTSDLAYSETYREETLHVASEQCTE